jgi:SulP family sulfate permease
MRDVFAIDATGLHALDEVRGRLERQGIPLLLSGVRAQPLLALTGSGGLERLGESNVLGSFRDAVARAWELTEGNSDGTPGVGPA